jgi:hypothetical protein
MPGSVIAMGRVNRPSIMVLQAPFWKMERESLEYCSAFLKLWEKI